MIHIKIYLVRNNRKCQAVIMLYCDVKYQEIGTERVKRHARPKESLLLRSMQTALPSMQSPGLLRLPDICTHLNAISHVP